MKRRLAWPSINVWIGPMVIGAAVGIAVSVAFYFFYGLWRVFDRALATVPNLAYSFIFLSIILSSLPIRMFLKRRPKDSFDVVLEYYHTSPGSMSLRDSLLYALSSFLSFAFGAPVGPEGGAVLVGAGISKKVRDLLGVEIDQKTILMTGLAAGFTALFKAPLSGFLLSLELPYKGDLEKDPFLPSALASATSYLTSFVLKTPSIMSPVSFQAMPLTITVIAISLAFGIVSGLFSIGFISFYRAFSRIAQNLMRVASFPLLILIGGLLVGTLGYLFPASIGPGFGLLSSALLVKLGLTAALLALVIRIVTVSSVINFGASGGLLLPSIEIGALFGYVIGYAFYPRYLVLFVLLGMASMAAGVNKIVLVPVTFLLELVGGSMAIPLLISSIASYFISYRFTIYEYQPANKLDRGTFALERFYSRALRTVPHVSEVMVKDIMNRNPVFIEHGKTVDEAFRLLKEKTLKVLPVVNEDGVFLGYVTIEYLASLPERYRSLTLADLEIKRGLTVSSTSRLGEVVEAMLSSEEDHVFVVDEGWKLIGVLTEVDIIRFLLSVLP